MTISTSNNLGLISITTNTEGTLWGGYTNTNLITLLTEALSGYASYSCSGGTDALTITGGASSTARSMYIQLTGTGGGSVTVPHATTKLYFVYNSTVLAITFKTDTGTGISVPAGGRSLLVCDGTNIVSAIDVLTSASLASPPAIGGTTPAAGSFTTLTATGTLTSKKITDNGNVTIAAPASGNALVVAAVSGTHSTKIADSANNSYNAGFLELPVNAQGTPYATVLSDNGKILYYSATGAAAFTITGSVAYPIGASLTFVNDATGATSMTIAITTDTMVLAGSGTTGSRSLVQYGQATAVKVAAGRWYISGPGLT